MVLQEAWTVTSDLILCPLLFAIAVIDFLPNPARYLIRRMVQHSSAEQHKSLQGGPRKPGRKILMAVDETSHEAVDWAVRSFLVPWSDFVHLVYIPEGDFARSTYRYPMYFNRYNYMDTLEGVDFLWEYCQRLDLANIDFECHVIQLDKGKDVPASILTKSAALRPELLIMGASKRSGPEDVGAVTYQVSLKSSVPVIVVK